MKACEICGKPFEGYRERQLTCSRKCSKELQKLRQRQLYEKRKNEKMSRLNTFCFKKIGNGKTRVWYDKGLFVDWSEKEFAKIKRCKDKAYV